MHTNFFINGLLIMLQTVNVTLLAQQVCSVTHQACACAILVYLETSAENVN